MYKQIFKKENGEPDLIEATFDEESMIAVFDFDKEIYTDKKPQDGLYDPIHFDEDSNEWVGATYEEWVDMQGDPPTYTPDNVEVQLAQTQMQLAKTAVQLLKAQKELADCMTESAKKEQRLKVLEQQQAESMLEIAKLKGE